MVNEWFEFEETQVLKKELEFLIEDLKSTWARGEIYGEIENARRQGICVGLQSMLDWINSRKDI